MIKTQSAGIVIVRYEDNIPKILLMRAYSYWDFPKGGVEINENKLMAAIREVREESGIVNLDFRWGKVFYETEPYGKTRKVVSYFLAETTEKVIVMGINPDIGKPEHEEYRWVNFEEAYRLAGDRIKKVLLWAQERMVIVNEFNQERLIK
jgi:bis(5'-nucleosidyl)-tetraphosphatase